MVAAAVSADTGMLAGENEWAEVIIIVLVILLEAMGLAFLVIPIVETVKFFQREAAK